MSKTSGSAPEKQSNQDELMKISDYSQGRESNQYSSEVDEYPFDDLENILGPEDQMMKKQVLYKQKISQLQTKCSRLFKTASFLTKRIEDLQIQLEEQTQNELSPQQMNQFLGQLQQQIQQYRKELKFYREKHLTNNAAIQQIQNLKGIIQDLKQQNRQLEANLLQFEQQNMELKETNSNLLSQIQLLESQLEETKASQNYLKKPKKYQRTAFDDQIQAELQILIEKLMAQLQVQRGSNKKVVQELKRMQQTVLELEKQVVKKNTKIYSLQMSQLKANKLTPKQELNNQRLNFYSKEKSFNAKNKSDRNSALKNITLQEFIANYSEGNERERYLVASKITNFFIKKVEAQDFDPLNPDQLIVCNYNKLNPSLTSIKKVSNIPPYSGEASSKVLSWNLSVILSKLLIQPSYDSEQFDQNIKILTQSIDQFIEEQDPSIQSFTSIKNLLDELLKTIK